jgi:hypothetical protein
MSFDSATPQPGGKVKPFGPNDELLYALSDARGGESRIGAILWGLGVAEVKTARRLATKGIVSLQVRINGPEFYDDARRNEIYRKSGIDYCMLAMEKLAAERGVTSFILMGNCACANICFHTAVADSRVVGLILTNPYVAKAQLVRAAFWHHLSKAAARKRLWTGGTAQVRGLLGNLQRLIGDHLGLRTGLSGKADASKTEIRQPIELPENLDRELRKLCDRGSKILVACSTSDDSLRYLRKRYGSELSELQAEGNLRFVAVVSSAHVFSTDDSAASLLNDAISNWVETTTFVAGAATRSKRDPELGFSVGTPVAR